MNEIEEIKKFLDLTIKELEKFKYQNHKEYYDKLNFKYEIKKYLIKIKNDYHKLINEGK